MGRRYSRVRNSEYSENLFSCDGREGPTFLRKISREKGERLVAEGRAIRHDGPRNGECLGYQLLASGASVGLRAVKGSGGESAESAASSCILTTQEAEAAVGLKGPSKTENLPEWGRLQRIARGLKDMDYVELAKVKLNSFAPMYSA